MILDKETDTLMREWNDELQKKRLKPLIMFSISIDGKISITQTNEVTKEHIIDMCERVAEIYKAK